VNQPISKGAIVMKKMKVFDHPSILQATVIKVEEGSQPNRIVLRHVEDNNTPYVVHSETLEPKQNGDVLEWHHRDFCNGHYVATLEAAKNIFESKR
jgi:hypothetical protein